MNHTGSQACRRCPLRLRSIRTLSTTSTWSIACFELASAGSRARSRQPTQRPHYRLSNCVRMSRPRMPGTKATSPASPVQRRRRGGLHVRRWRCKSQVPGEYPPPRTYPPWLSPGQCRAGVQVLRPGGDQNEQGEEDIEAALGEDPRKLGTREQDGHRRTPDTPPIMPPGRVVVGLRDGPQ